jgi:hypothetical protein
MKSSTKSGSARITVSNSVSSKSPKIKPKERDWSRLQFYTNIALVLMSIVIAYWYLPITNSALLFKIQEFSLFVPTVHFFNGMMKVPGGFLSWAGTFFTQFFYYPWLGSSILIFFSILLQWLTIKALRIPHRFFYLTFVLPFAVLLAVTQLGYLIYSVKLPGYVFSNVLGATVAMALVWLYRLIRPFNLRLALGAVLLVTGYPLLGFYALLAGIIVSVTEFYLQPNQPAARRWIIPALYLVLIAAVPYLYAVFHYTHTYLGYVYVSGLPLLTQGETFAYLPYYVLIGALLSFSAFQFLSFTKPVRVFSYGWGLVFFGLLTTGVVKFSYEDTNFRTELEMDRAIFENRWEDVLKLSASQTDEPTRRIVMSTNLALQKLGRAGDEMFRYRQGSKTMNAPWPVNYFLVAGKQFYFQYGRANFAYHWSVEDMVERGLKVEDLLYMVKCSLIKGEYNLARKYNAILHKTFFYRKWAEKYQGFIEEPASMLEDEEFKSLLPLTAFEDQLKGNNELMEFDLLNDFAMAEIATPLAFELALQNALILKQPELFWPRFQVYASMQKKIPRHYQEAALIFAFHNENYNISNIPFDKEVLDRFNAYMTVIKSLYTQNQKMNERFFTSFRDTYWNYKYFTSQLKIQ